MGITRLVSGEPPKQREKVRMGQYLLLIIDEGEQRVGDLDLPGQRRRGAPAWAA